MDIYVERRLLRSGLGQLLEIAPAQKRKLLGLKLTFEGEGSSCPVDVALHRESPLNRILTQTAIAPGVSYLDIPEGGVVIEAGRKVALTCATEIETQVTIEYCLI